MSEIFTYMDDLPRSEKHEDRWYETAENLKVHATTEDKVDKILKEGLKPRGETNCIVWTDEQIPYSAQTNPELMNLIYECRLNNVYMWDDYQEGALQGLATVGFLKEGNPAVLIIDTSGLKLERDPEIEADEEEEPVSYMYHGEIPPERINCVCKLDDAYKPTVGNILCQTMHDADECPINQDIESIYEDLADLQSWKCKCRW